MSTRPGARHAPLQSMSVATARGICRPIAAILPSATSTAPISSRPLAGSSRRALRRRRGLGGGAASFIADASWQWRAVAEIARQQLEARHAHGDAHLDLLADDAAVDVVGDLAVDFDAAVHRARMHDERVGLRRLQLLVVEAEEVIV